MGVRVAINGFGRIGRNVLRALYESGRYKKIEIVAINDLGDSALNAHLVRYDSVHGRFPGHVDIEGDSMVVNGHRIKISTEPDLSKLSWGELNVDIVHECTGLFTARGKAAMHLNAGAKKVLVSAPVSGADATVVYGVNHEILNSAHRIISNASCTTNCLAPVAKALNDALGIIQGQMTTIHSYTNDQNLSDMYHADIYRARSATQSMIPSKTGAAQAVGLVLPELKGRLDGMAIRVPTINVSLVDFHFIAGRETSTEEVNAIMRDAADKSIGGVLTYVDEPLVSVDFNHTPASSNFDANHTRVMGHLVKVMAWYDNEWGFAHRMLDNTLVLANTNSSYCP